MITLNDVCIHPYYLSSGKMSSKEDRILERYKIRTSQELFYQMASGNPEFNSSVFNHLLEISMEIVQKVNAASNQPILYTFSLPLEYKQYEKKVEEIDSHIPCSTLPVNSPTSPYYTYRLNDYPISVAKDLLGKVNFEGNNAFCVDRFNRKFLEKYVRLIEFHDTYICSLLERSEDPDREDESIFYKDSAEKLRRIESIYEDIILYLADHDEFQWGGINRNALLGTINSKKTSLAKQTLINYIANYCSLEELMGNVRENGALKKFVMTTKK
ncbi:MAG: hypothetical protein HFG33_00905 [Bacilli bacterium]|nr:hypothetical protein [Bacilli bacterium]